MKKVFTVIDDTIENMRETFENVCEEVLILERAKEGYQERAINAEAEVERLRLMVKSITGGLDECMETVHFLEAENAKLRKVVDAAHVAVAYLQTQPTIQHILVQALADLDEEGER